MTPIPMLKPALVALLATVLVACTTVPAPTVRRDAQLPRPVMQVGGVPRDAEAGVDGIQEEALADGPRAQLHRGSGTVINQSVARSAPPNLAGSTGEATFNFEGESLHAVIKVILGDMLGQNYVIAPGVQGTVTLATPKTVSPAQALSLLEMVLGWNNARMIYADGRYNIVGADQAMASGAVAPRTGSAAAARGFESRVVPLRYISAAEMEKLLKPYARANAIISVDSGRNVITVAGTRQELENYLRTIEIFDVDWLSGMSVGVFPLVAGKAAQVVSDLEKVFGEQSKSPVAGMFRFMPLDGANSVLVITSQPEYLGQIEQWIERIDGAGGGVQLFSYELKYITAKDLAERLSEVYGSRGGSSGGRAGASLMPGLESTEIRDGGMDGGSSAQVGGDPFSGGSGGDSGSGSGLGSGSLSLGERTGGNAAVTLEVDGDKVGVSAVDETNTLLVRSTGQAWRSIRQVIDRLDIMPLQVHIEAQVVEVTLSGDLSYGVNWFFERAVTDAGLPSAVGRETWSAIAGNVTGSQAGGVAPGLAWTFLGRNAAAIISALDEVSDVQMLQTPSVMVRNNYEATLNVGSRIPISSVTVNPGFGGDSSYSQVQYLDTGTILKVRPRVTRDGTVFLDIVQEVSSPGSQPDQNGNVRIDTRRLKTNAIVQSGDTVMLAGLIQDSTTRGSLGFPGLSRIPVLGGLFGRQSSNTTRSEVIVLMTPTLVRNQQDARDLTDEYGRRFRALEPLNRSRD
ncbi:type II secretion system secretin GspD [Luteimonas sp. MC1825]|uniref:type II secretion system secretin GspD n=1 Tax=Luteimonas sp. MC1825 TaxID=2761107 RepID=UPI00160AD7F0|nr:type II secretion system secretin GspD [Luteimonas sp. MC1825]MBB6600051.1 type II secretion system secretin GspD [Luteimonas sp. MC1825]QOC87753.1 type II secretion system secretin GspD [Luteimonas sp. MC1825]